MYKVAFIGIKPCEDVTACLEGWLPGSRFLSLQAPLFKVQTQKDTRPGSETGRDYPQHSIGRLPVCFCTSAEPSSPGHCQEGQVTPLHAVAGISGEDPELREPTSFTVGSLVLQGILLLSSKAISHTWKILPDSLSSHPS